MSKPHITCYDMECDECLERVTCPHCIENSRSRPEGPRGGNAPTDIALLAAQVHSLSVQLEGLQGAFHQMKERFDRVLSAVVRTSSDDSSGWGG